jgi:hypothetical protein
MSQRSGSQSDRTPNSMLVCSVEKNDSKSIAAHLEHKRFAEGAFTVGDSVDTCAGVREGRSC